MIISNDLNYHTWNEKIEYLRYVNNYYLLVFTTEKSNNKYNGKILLHRRVYGYMRQGVDDNVLSHVNGETHDRTLWSKNDWK